MKFKMQTEAGLKREMGELLERVRAQRPLIHNITNYVTVNDCANVILAAGASPIMADAIEEAADIASVSAALVLNMGTLNARTLEAMAEAGKAANAAGVPVVFDPVGAGASPFRNEAAAQLIGSVKLAVLRGNLSEIKFIAGIGTSSRGVDAADTDAADTEMFRAELASALARKIGAVVAITGAVDVVSDGSRTVYVKNGVPELSLVTGTGCMCTALIGAFAGATENAFLAAVCGISAMGLAGETALATYRDAGSGSYRVAVIDAVSRMRGETLTEGVNVYED